MSLVVHGRRGVSSEPKAAGPAGETGSPAPGVCMVISSYWPIIGGAEGQCALLAGRLMDRGVRTVVLTRRRGTTVPARNGEPPVRRLPVVGTGALGSLTFTGSALAWLARHHAGFPVIHCHQALSPATIGLLAKAAWGQRVVVKVQGAGAFGDLAQIRARPLAGLRLRLLRRADALVAVSGAVEAELREAGLGGARIVRIPNGVDSTRFCPPPPEVKAAIRKRLDLPPGGRVAIFTGRFDAAKGLDLLLRAWSRLVVAGGRPAPTLLLVGEGALRPELIRMVGALGLGESVRFVDPPPSVLEFLQAADCFALPSISEGLSNALLEAMACGLPVIASDHAANREALGDGEAGLLIPSRDPEAWADGLRALLGAAQGMPLGTQARSRVEAHYAMETVVARYLDLYRSLQ